MKIGPILAALGGGITGLGASGAFGGGASDALFGISPLLALLLHKKKHKDNYAEQDAAVPPTGPVGPQTEGDMRRMLMPGMPGTAAPGLMPFIGPRG